MIPIQPSSQQSIQHQVKIIVKTIVKSMSKPSLYIHHINLEITINLPLYLLHHYVKYLSMLEVLPLLLQPLFTCFK